MESHIDVVSLQQASMLGKDPDDGSGDEIPKTPKTSRSSRSPNNRINLPKEFPRLRLQQEWTKDQ